MPKKVAFTVSKRDGPSVEVSFMEPENLTDERWKAIVSNPDEDINTLAVAALRVRLQAGARDELEDGEAAVQKYVDSYVYKSGGTRAAAKPGAKLSKEAAKKGKFSAAQLAMLKEAGFAIEEDETLTKDKPKV